MHVLLPPPPAMNSPLHLLGLRREPLVQSGVEAVQLVRPTDVQWGAPIFRAPALPTPQQISSEIPFTVNFRGRIRQRAG